MIRNQCPRCETVPADDAAAVWHSPTPRACPPSVLFPCAGCGRPLVSASHRGGQQVRCPTCATHQTVPEKGLPAVPPMAPTAPPASDPGAPPLFSPFDLAMGAVVVVLLLLAGVAVGGLALLPRSGALESDTVLARAPEGGGAGSWPGADQEHPPNPPPAAPATPSPDRPPAPRPVPPRQNPAPRGGAGADKEKAPPAPPATAKPEAPRPEEVPASGQQESRPPPTKDTPAPRRARAKADEDLPEVSLTVPEETRPEDKALLRANVAELGSSKVAAQRIKAAQVLGKLGEQGKPARKALCRAMLDRSAEVRVAAADALQTIDPKLQYLAVALATVQEPAKLWELLVRIEKLEEDVEPLVPLVADLVARTAAPGDSGSLLQQQMALQGLATLSRIGKNDLQACRVVASALSNRDPAMRQASLRALARMKHGRLAVPNIVRVLRNDVPENRVVAVEALTALADGSTEELLAEAIAGQRYHPDERVRKAVAVALNKLDR